MFVWCENPTIRLVVLQSLWQAETILCMQEMKPEVLKALKSSIAHWERLASGKRIHNEGVGVDDCALCKMFNRHINLNGPDLDTRCFGCPVREHTGQQFCRGTPFILAEEISDKIDEFDEPLDTAMFKEAAQKELEFLKSLLPKNE